MRGDLRSEGDRKQVVAWMESGACGNPVSSCMDDTLRPWEFSILRGVLHMGKEAFSFCERHLGPGVTSPVRQVEIAN